MGIPLSSSLKSRLNMQFIDNSTLCRWLFKTLDRQSPAGRSQGLLYAPELNWTSIGKAFTMFLAGITEGLKERHPCDGH